MRHLTVMFEPEQNNNLLIEVLEQLCLVVERTCIVVERNSLAMDNLREDLHPELKKTATLERLKREKAEIKSAAESAVQNRKIKTRGGT